MEELFDWVGQNHEDIDARAARKFLNKYARQIDWKEFEDWSEDVVGEEGYDWVRDVHDSS